MLVAFSSKLDARQGELCPNSSGFNDPWALLQDLNVNWWVGYETSNRKRPQGDKARLGVLGVGEWGMIQ